MVGARRGYPSHAQARGPGGIVELIGEIRHDQLRPAGAQRLRQSADAAMMYDRRRAREQQRVRRVGTNEYLSRTPVSEFAETQFAHQQHRASLRGSRSAKALPIEASGTVDDETADGKHQRRRTGLQKRVKRGVKANF